MEITNLITSPLHHPLLKLIYILSNPLHDLQIHFTEATAVDKAKTTLQSCVKKALHRIGQKM
jgi:hypothetical protein